MEIRFSRIYVIIHLFAVFALFVSPFIFFNVYADDSQNVWKVVIENGVSENQKSHGFFPNELPVFAGDTVIWENKDSVNHSITSGLPQSPEQSGLFFNLGQISSGDSVSHIFTNTDFSAFYYFCEIHPWMTGKIFFSELDIAQPETQNPMFLEKQNYVYGDKISITGQVHADFAGTKYTTLIYNQNDELVDSSKGFFDYDGSYVQNIDAKGNDWDTDGNYQLKMVYALPSKVAETSFQFSTIFNENEETMIPIWIKNVGEYWCNGDIGDADFVNAVEYLIKNDIIGLKNQKSDTVFSNEVPEWIKNNACWWSNDKIPDIDFIFGIEYLVNIGTIRV